MTAALLACEIASEAKANGLSFYEELLGLYKKHDYYKEHLIAIVKKGIKGADEIAQMMVDLRENPLTEIDGSQVTWLYDYKLSKARNLVTGETKEITIPKENVLIYYTADGTKIAARPSGTEPKIKFYFSVNAKLNSIDNAKKVAKQLDTKIQRIIKEMKL